MFAGIAVQCRANGTAGSRSSFHRHQTSSNHCRLPNRLGRGTHCSRRICSPPIPILLDDPTGFPGFWLDKLGGDSERGALPVLIVAGNLRGPGDSRQRAIARGGLVYYFAPKASSISCTGCRRADPVRESSSHDRGFSFSHRNIAIFPPRSARRWRHAEILIEPADHIA